MTLKFNNELVDKLNNIFIKIFMLIFGGIGYFKYTYIFKRSL